VKVKLAAICIKEVSTVDPENIESDVLAELGVESKLMIFPYISTRRI
jgi:ribosomal protein L20A (L18A)